MPDCSKTGKAHGLQPVGFGSARAEVPFSSNNVRLSPREWLVAGAIAAVAFWLIPLVWQGIEPFEPGPDYRIPSADSARDLKDDYWMYRRWCGEACRRDKILVVGDSAIWGYFVSADQTLPHYLNELAGDNRFANLGVNGTHTTALAGLVEYYGRAMAGKRVLLFCNLVWMTSGDADLQTTPEERLLHPRLLPQFSPRIPCYKEPLEVRLGVAVQRSVALLSWTLHLRIAYFESGDLAAWTCEHPYENPLRAITLELPSPQEPPPDAEAEPWLAKKGIQPYNSPGVDPQTSIQWAAFQRTVKTLQDRGNRVFVLVGPFNEHMLTPRSRPTYQKLKSEVAAWLEKEEIPHCLPPVLPSELYADGSHPLAAGYQEIARRLWANESFAKFRQGD